MAPMMTNEEPPYRNEIFGACATSGGNVSSEDEERCEVASESEQLSERALHPVKSGKASLCRDSKERAGWLRNYPNSAASLAFADYTLGGKKMRPCECSSGCGEVLCGCDCGMSGNY